MKPTSSSGAGISRRSLIAGAAALPLAATSRQAPASAQTGASLDWSMEAAAARARAQLKDASGTKLVLLGTGAGPTPGHARRMTSHVMVSNGATYILDCGLGVTNQYARTGLTFDQIRSIFITHFHPDHSVEYLPLLVIGWVQGLRPDLAVYGPPPLTQMTADIIRSQRTVIDFWAEDFKMKPLANVATHELATAGAVMSDANVRVTSVLVEHPPVKPAYGYRFDFHDRSIAFSGDTVPLEAVARMAKGADVLVHEAMYVPVLDRTIKDRIAHGMPTTYDAFMKHMFADHSKAEDVGRIATEAGVKTLVLSHLTPGDGATDAEWRAAAATNFSGEIIVGHDLMVV